MIPGAEALRHLLPGTSLVFHQLAPPAERLTVSFLLEVQDTERWEQTAFQVLGAVRDRDTRDQFYAKYGVPQERTFAFAIRNPTPWHPWSNEQRQKFTALALAMPSAQMPVWDNLDAKTAATDLIAASDPGDGSLLYLLDAQWSSPADDHATLRETLEAFSAAHSG
jgi:hypothetical protein